MSTITLTDAAFKYLLIFAFAVILLLITVLVGKFTRLDKLVKRITAAFKAAKDLFT